MSTAPRLSRSVLSTLRSQTRRPLRNAQKSSRYHSYDHPSPPPFPPAESAILSAALAHVPEHGFTTAALKLGARDAGYLDVSTNLLPRGVFELVNYHLVTQRLALRERVQFPTADGDPNQSNNNSRQRNNGVGTGGKVRTLTLARLRANEPILHRWQEALAIMAQPSYLPAALAELARLADEIWFLAGDASVDTSWYTKRASLSAVYSASEVFMTQDRSAGYADTEQFVDARLADVTRVGSVLGALGQWVDYTGHSAVNVLRSKGVRI